jgi:hypothetical protein
MNAADLRAKTTRLKEELLSLKEFWAAILPPEFTPSDRQFLVWLNMYGGFENVAGGLEATAMFLSKAEGKGIVKTQDDLVRYASGCMKNIAQGASRES